MYPINSHKTIQ